MYESGDELGLINNDKRYGWDNRTVILANSGLEIANFTAIFTGSVAIKASIFTALCVLILTQ